VNPTNNTAFTPTANTTSRLDIVKASSGSGSYGSIFTDSAFSQSGTLTATQQYSIGADDSAGQVTLRIKFTPDVSGTYTFLVSTPNAVADVTALPTTGVTSSYYDASTVDTSAAFGVTTGATATAITLSAVTAAPAALSTGVPAQIIKITMAGGTSLASGETLTVTTTGSATLGVATATSASAATSYVISSCASTCYFRVDDTVSESVTTTVTGSGTLSSTVTSSIGTTFTASGTAIAITAAPVSTDTSLVAASAHQHQLQLQLMH